MERLLRVLLESGIGTASLTTAEKILQNEITVFDDQVRIDVLTSAPDVDFNGAWSRRQVMSYQGQDFFVIGRDDLIASKKATGRAEDLADVRALEVGERSGG